MIAETLLVMQILKQAKKVFSLQEMQGADNHLLSGQLQKVEVQQQPLIDISLGRLSFHHR
jgi:hypothetical protein